MWPLSSAPSALAMGGIAAEAGGAQMDELEAMAVDKSQLVERWREHLESRLESLDASQAAARAGTRVDGAHRPANRGERAAVTSQGYLAHGLGQRMEALTETLRLLGQMGSGQRSRIVVGAWVVGVPDGGAGGAILRGF